MSYFRVKKFNTEESQRELTWKISWFKILLPGAMALTENAGAAEDKSAEYVGKVVDSMVKSVYRMYQFLPTSPKDELSVELMTDIQHYVMAEASRLVNLAPEYLCRMKQLIGSEMLNAWSDIYKEYQGMELPRMEVDIDSLLDVSRDEFISTAVLQLLRGVEDAVLDYVSYHDIMCDVMVSVNDAIMRRNRVVVEDGKKPWVLLGFPEPSDMAAVAVKTDAYLLPDFEASCAEEDWLKNLKVTMRKDYLCTLNRELARMESSSIMQQMLFESIEIS